MIAVAQSSQKTTVSRKLPEGPISASVQV